MKKKISQATPAIDELKRLAIAFGKYSFKVTVGTLGGLVVLVVVEGLFRDHN